jgi:hypothetical protein
MRFIKVYVLSTGKFLISSCDTLNQAAQILSQTSLGNPSATEISPRLKQAMIWEPLQDQIDYPEQIDFLQMQV